MHSMLIINLPTYPFYTITQLCAVIIFKLAGGLGMDVDYYNRGGYKSSCMKFLNSYIAS